MTPAETIARRIACARYADAAAYAIERNLRLRRYHGRNGESTAATLEAHLERFAVEVATLVRELGDDGRFAAGLLTAEADLRRRTGEARDAGERRPELEARLRRIRANLRLVA